MIDRRGSSRTGGPAAWARSTTNGAVTIRSIDGFSSPPRADQTSAIERSLPSGRAVVTIRGRGCPASAPAHSDGASRSWRMKQPSRLDRSRCSSSGRWVQAVTMYASLNRRAGGRRSVTRPASSRTRSHWTSRRAMSSRMSYRYRSTVGPLRRATQSRVGASNATSTAAPPSASVRTRASRVSSTSWIIRSMVGAGRGPARRAIGQSLGQTCRSRRPIGRRFPCPIGPCRPAPRAAPEALARRPPGSDAPTSRMHRSLISAALEGV